MKTMKQLGKQVRGRRLANGFTLPQVARFANVSKGTLSKLENGKAKDIGIMTLQKILQPLGGL
jgi:transcriptional regulator with XRE-family HTH domain